MMTSTKAAQRQQKGSSKKESFERARLTYQTIASRRLQHENLMWQVPALSLSAQAFLLAIALGHDTSQVPRILSSVLSFIVGLNSMHLLAKHRYFEVSEAKTLHWLEDRHGLLHVHDTPKGRDKWQLLELDKPEKKNWIIQQSAYKVWLGTLSIFAAASLGIALAALQRFDGF